MSLAVAEIFGPTVQGEGPNAGRRCSFVRLGLCNLDCSWCDTPYTWDWSRFDRRAELTKMADSDVAAAVRAHGTRRVVITGGEPLVQRMALPWLFDQLPDHVLEVETNGTIAPDAHPAWDRVHFNVSPKLANSGVSLRKRLNIDALSVLVHDHESILKFVVVTTADFDEARWIVDAVGCPDDRVWVMPEGTHPRDLRNALCSVAPAAIERGWNVSTRLHVELWGNQRGH